MKKDLLEDSEMGNLSSIHDAKHGEAVAQPSGVQETLEGAMVHKSNSQIKSHTVKDAAYPVDKGMHNQNKPLSLPRGQVVNHRYSLRSRA